MKEADMTREQMIGELTYLRRRVAELEARETRLKPPDKLSGKSGLGKAEVLESITELVAYQDTDMVVLWANKAACESVGLALEELVGHHCYEIWSKRSEPCVDCPVVKARETGQPQSTEMLTPDGRHWFVQGYPILNQEGRIASVIEITLEITESRRVEEALRKSEEYNTSLLENAQNPVMVLNPDNTVRYINPALEELTGFTLEEVSGRKPPRPWWIEGETQEIMDRLCDRMPEGGQATEEVRFRKKNGEIFWVNISTVLTERDGELSYMLINWLDITERKRAEEAMQRNEAQLSAAVEIAKLGYWEFDLAEREFIFNDHFYSIFKTSAEKVGGYRMTQERYRELFIHPDDRYLMVDDGIEKSFESPATPLRNRLEHRILYADGGIGYISVRAYAETDGDGKIIRIYGANQDITERKRAEEALRKSEERLAMAVEATNLGLWDWMVQTGETVFNERWANILGYTLEELVPVSIDTWTRLAHPDDLRRSNELLQKHFAGETEFYECEARMKHKNGGWVWVLDKGRVVAWDDAGKPVRAIGTHFDITERKKAEEKNRTIINTALEGFCIANGEGRFIEVNESYCDMSGYSREELLGMSVPDVEARESREETSEHFKHMLIKGSEVFETRHRRKDGKLIDVEVSVHSLDMEDRQALMFMHDITERKQAEEVFRTLADNSPIGIYIVQNGKFQYVNASLQKQMDYSEGELLGRDSLSFVFPEDREKVRENAINMGLGMTGTPYEYRVVNREGKTKWVMETVAPIMYRGKQAIAGSQMDITEQKMLEEEQQRIEKLESIGTLAGGIAHDFNNILTGIMGYISLALREVAPDSKIAERLQEAEKASIRARDLTHRLLTFARGGAPIKKTISVAEVLRESVNFALRGSSVRCESSLPDDLWSVEADEGQLNQVFTNLVINAVEAMPLGGILEINARNLPIKKTGSLPLPEGNFVTITVADHGTGMSRAHLERVFEPYFTTKQRGSGLGLATSYSIVKSHDGYMTVESELGFGTTFFIYLPASEKPAPVLNEVTEELQITGNGRILVMDDEDGIRLLLSRMLGAKGYEVELARDGEEAIRKYIAARETGRPFAAVIMDLTIPGGVGGKEAIARLREIDPKVKAIVSSGYSTDPIMADYQAYGFSGVIAKPYQVGQLDKTLQNVLLDSDSTDVTTASP